MKETSASILVYEMQILNFDVIFAFDPVDPILVYSKFYDSLISVTNILDSKKSN